MLCARHEPNSNSNPNCLGLAHAKYLRLFHTESVLSNETVLIAGVTVRPFTAELYDLLTSNWTPTGNMTYPRMFHTASVFSNGVVLVAGGVGYFIGAAPTFGAELYNP